MSQQDSLLHQIGQDIDNYNTFSPIEKVYLHTDRSFYVGGEDLWYSAYLVLGPFHLPSQRSKVLHVDLVAPDGSIVLSQTQSVNSGRGRGSMEVSSDLLPGKYRLRAYTDWMRNFKDDFFFAKEITVLGEKDIKFHAPQINSGEIDLQFFPEGGHAVAGLVGKVAFRAVGRDGLPCKVEGHILDSERAPIAFFKSFYDGSGSFAFTPKAGEHYTAELVDGQFFTFPEVIEEGYAMTVNNLDTGKVKVIIRSSPGIEHKAFYLIGTIRNQVYYQGRFEMNGKKSVKFELPTRDLPGGVMAITLLDNLGNPLCERVVFIPEQDNLSLSVQMDAKVLKRRSKLGFDIHVENENGEPVQMDLSVSITDVGKALRDPNGRNISSYLLLESDISGSIPFPGLFLSGDSRDSRARLDLVMLTHGWRKYNHESFRNDEYKKYKFPFLQGIALTGTARKENGKPLENVKINLFGQSKSGIEIALDTTDEKGCFRMDGITLEDSIRIVLSAFNEKGSKLFFDASLEKEFTEPPLASALPVVCEDTIQQEDDVPSLEEKYWEFSRQKALWDSLYKTNSTIQLEEVVVEANKVELEMKPATPSVYEVIPDATVYTDARTFDIFQLLNTVSGLWILRSGIEASVSVRGESTIWMLDGNFTSINEILSLPVSCIERIEVLKTVASRAVFGLRGSGPMILVYTKLGGYVEKESALQFTLFGHDGSKEFYVPKYDEERDNPRPDERATLYWSPSIKTDDNGNASFEFFNSDNARQIQVCVEGVTPGGKPVFFIGDFGGGRCCQ
ncbi:hypothetical protein ACUNWD_18740 [Sunxiuqinia sp. A32]|uniref:hypothetical protein n=1 Tax=Sunxiuqinia sp. A32 TaxID=3461496 RepID=UPI004045970E